MKLVAFILNLPWSILMFVAAFLSALRTFSFAKQDWALVVRVRSFWWYSWLPGHKRARGMAMGNVVLLGPDILEGDLEHELVHIRQGQRAPLIHPFLNFYQTLRYGYRKNKYEEEAYRLAGNPYLGKDE